MRTLTTNWTDEELKVYLALYCFNADCSKTNIGLDFSKFKIKKGNADVLIKEFRSDNDYQSIQKINTFIEKNKYSKMQVNKLFKDISDLIMSSGIKYNHILKSVILGLEKTLMTAA